MMDCERFAERLDAFLAERLSAEDRRAVEEHLGRCDDCRELAGLAGAQGLTDGILARTSGAVCTSAQERLCDHADGQLDSVDSDLVRGHLEGCEPCAALERVLERVSADLPLLAELEPDSRFLDDILERTRPRRRHGALWAARVAQAWERLVARPRFALEGAYIGSVALVLIFNLTGSPLTLQREVLDLARINPLQELKEPVSRFNANVTSSVEQAWGATADKVARGSRGVATISAAALGAIRTDLETIWAGITSGQETETNETSKPDGDTQGDES